MAYFWSKFKEGLDVKKLLLGSVLLISVMGVLNAKSYECNRYVNGKYEGFVKVHADSKSEAVNKAFEKYRKLNEGPFTNMKVDSIKCEIPIF